MRLISQRPLFPKWKLLSWEIEAASESEEESAKTGSAHRVLRVTTWWDPKFEVGVACGRRVKGRVKNQKRWHLPIINQYQHQRDPPPKKWFWSEGRNNQRSSNFLFIVLFNFLISSLHQQSWYNSSFSIYNYPDYWWREKIRKLKKTTIWRKLIFLWNWPVSTSRAIF